MNKKEYILPLLPLRGLVVYPHMSVTFDIGRETSNQALKAAMDSDKMIFLSAQMDMELDEPGIEDVYQIGTIASVKQILKLPNGTRRALVEGVSRAVIKELVSAQPYMTVRASEIKCPEGDYDITDRAFVRKLQEEFEKYFTSCQSMTPDVFLSIMAVSDPSVLADRIASSVNFPIDIKQKALECADVYERAELLLVELARETEVLKIEEKISRRVQKQVEENQKEYYLREQLKAIQKELGDKDGISAEAKAYRDKIKALRAKKEVKEKLLKDADRFEKMQSSSADSAVMRNYFDTVLSLPWNKKTKESFDINKASEVLERDHYGLEKVKQRVLEYLSVHSLKKNAQGPILCLVGPPGVGKTSIVKSIAESLGRKYVRISLGGIHDEADIRGHRKTYIGAMEGRIMDAVNRAGSKNPLMLLDEIDKMGADYKGDPAAALLEVLDAEQNFAFRDHYIEVPFDLSDVLFITTANTLDTVSRPLLDRMEVIELSGYIEDEKFNIVKKYLIPKQIKRNGLEDKKLTFTDEAVHDIINHYTREAGVRNLEREIGSVCRKAAKSFLESGKKSLRITQNTLITYLGKHKFNFDLMNEKNEVGVARGLAWTQVGGDTLSIEVNIMAGTGKVELTGKLGDVMKESAMTAISYIRSQAESFGIDASFYKTRDIHIHVPEGAVPKDGPSAGITIATALVSALTGRAVRRDVAMTGEITLRGRVLPIGGLKEKSLAAFRAEIKTIIIPEKNIADLDEIPNEIRKQINFVTADCMEAVLNEALTDVGKPYMHMPLSIVHNTREKARALN